MGSGSKRKLSQSSVSTSSSDDSDSNSDVSRRRRRHRKHDASSRREKERKRAREEEKRKRRKERKKGREKDRKHSKSRKKKSYESDSESALSGSYPDPQSAQVGPEFVMRDMLREFPNVGGDLKQLLQMIDDGQAVDIKGISESSLIKHLKKLFLSLNLKESGDDVFLLRSNARPTLDVVGPLIEANVEGKDKQCDHSLPVKDAHAVPPNPDHIPALDENSSPVMGLSDNSSASKRRIIGPEMPSADLLAAAAKLTEAQAELREAELEEDSELFIGPPPPAMVAEAESANEAERFEEVTRIMSAEADSPYDVIGLNRDTSMNNIKKRYWKLSLLVHPDKCPHPQAHQAFIILNKAFKELQDPDKRKMLDEKIKAEDEKEQFKAELRAMREAARWRQLQGISMEGDDELLAEMEVKVAPKRDEWMTTVPPERKPGMTSQSTTRFSKSTKEGRGDTSVWTDTPSDRAQKAKMNYLEAYNEAAALASNNEQKRKANTDADLVDQYNKAKRSKSLVQKHQEESGSRLKKKSKQVKEKEEWVGNHPWKPWDREKDLVAGRKNIKLDSENMAEGLTGRFSSGSFERNFL
ncbi:hypothetical protein HS088_TW09G00644 [Tripterygium wilfordii]|uniref:J domain-containing protein n=1 Tax=Tripterygium wilfordii TaxID=458696 RepID=A0A7J7D8D8_TRIWF|nr:uncharacterized protein LOC120006573 [Tripterygium wilfordii]KAF5742593.1 hypothetical protein HS088_TW09G00644 [Tripterygium wilfordii]